MVEFAMVVWVFLLLMFGAISAALHSLQREVAETAASVGVQAAASADPNQPDQPNLQAGYAPTVAVLQPVMFNTTVQQLPRGSRCNNPNAIAPGNVEVCVYQDQFQGRTLVVERISGRPAYVIPFLAQWLNWSIDVTLGVHQVTYQP
jgi:Flp pilus assembly protein TadG